MPYGECVSASEVPAGQKGCNPGECISDPEHKQRCYSPNCGEFDSRYGIPCINNSDCEGDNGEPGLCNSASEFENKHFKHLGLCSKPNISKNDPRCYEIDFIAEVPPASRGESAQAHKCEVPDGSGNLGKKGISTYWAQCDTIPNQAVTNTIGQIEMPSSTYRQWEMFHGCARFDLCPNGWEALPHEASQSGGEYCISPQVAPYSCSESETQCGLPEGYCCQAGQQYYNTSTSELECCDTNDGVVFNGKCLFKPGRPYDAKYLNVSTKEIGEVIKCTVDGFKTSAQAEDLKLILQHSLGASGNEDVAVDCLEPPYYAQAYNPNTGGRQQEGASYIELDLKDYIDSATNSKLELKSGEGLIFGLCGKRSETGWKTATGIPPEGIMHRSAGEADPITRTNVCFAKSSCQENSTKWLSPSKKAGGGVSKWGTAGDDRGNRGGHPLCYVDKKNQGPDRDHPYWKGNKLETIVSQTYSEKDGSVVVPCSNPTTQIQYDLLNKSGYYDWSHNFSEPTSTYDYNVACDNKEVEIPSRSYSERVYPVLWPQLGDPDTYNPKGAHAKELALELKKAR